MMPLIGDILFQRLVTLLPLFALAFSICLAAYAIKRITSYVNTSDRLDPRKRIAKKSAVDPLKAPLNESSLPTSEAIDFFENLKGWVLKERPDFIVGVHISGLMIAAKIARELGYPNEKVAYYATTKSVLDDPELYEYGEGNGLSGKVCVVDDVTRRGVTLEQVSQRIFSDYQKGVNGIDDVAYGVMITARTASKVETGYFDPNFSAAETENQNIPLPWTRFMLGIRDEIERMKDGVSYNKNRVDTYKKMVDDLNFSLFCINLSLNDPDEFWKKFQKNCLYTDFLALQGEKFGSKNST